MKNYLIPVDFTATEARVFAAKIIAAADLADQYERDYDDYHEQEHEAYLRIMKEQAE